MVIPLDQMKLMVEGKQLQDSYTLVTISRTNSLLQMALQFHGGGAF